MAQIFVSPRRLHHMKSRSILCLLVAEVAAMSLWFVSAAILPDMTQSAALTLCRSAALSSGMQAGFVIGALFLAVLGIPDRFDPRFVFAASAVCAGFVNASLIFLEPGSDLAILARIATGIFLAGVYPVGMKIIVGWEIKDRGFLVGALALGSATPHLIALIGGSNWQLSIIAA